MSALMNNSELGFCDLNIPFTTAASSTLKDVMIEAVKLGYTTLVVNTILDEEYLLPVKKKAKKNDGTATNTSTKEIPPPPKLTFSGKDLNKFVSHGKNVNIYQRLSISFSDPSNCHKMIQSDNVKKYDIIAVTPTTSAAFQYTTGNLDVDIISLDPETTGTLKFNRRQFFQGVSRGCFYEISYSGLLKDSSLRKKIIQMGHSFHAIGKSRNVIVTSGASTPMELRGPHDVMNLSLLLGLSEGEARSALTSSSRSVVLHAASRKTGKCCSFAENMESENWVVRESKGLEKGLQLQMKGIETTTLASLESKRGFLG